MCLWVYATRIWSLFMPSNTHLLIIQENKKQYRDKIKGVGEAFSVV